MKYSALLLGCLMFSNCSLNSDNSCKATVVAFARQVSGPKTARVNENTKFTVLMQADNGCGKFDSFVEVSAGDTVQVAPKITYDGCVCAQTTPTIQADYTFRPTRPGKYYMQFLTDTSRFIVDTLVVQ